MFKIYNEHDFIVLGCDGVFDQLQSPESIKYIWKKIRVQSVGTSLHKICGIAVETLISSSIQKLSTDNVSVVILALSDFLNENIKDIATKGKNNETQENNFSFAPTRFQ